MPISTKQSIENKQDKISGVSDAEIGYLASVTSDIQGQINAIPTSFSDSAMITHTTTIGDYTQPSTAVGTSEGVNAGYLIQQSDEINVANGLLNIAVSNIDVDNCSFSWDIGATLSDSLWVARFKLTVSAFSQAGGGEDIGLFIGFTDVSSATSPSTNQDSIGMYLNWNNSIKTIKTSTSDGAKIGDTQISLFAEVISVTTWYVEIKRTSTTNFSVELFSDSGFSSSVEVEATNACAATTSALQYFVVGQTRLAQGTGSKSITATVSDVTIDDGVSTYAVSDYSTDFLSFPDDNAVNDNTAEYWESNAEINPAIYVDCGGSDVNLLGLAVYLHANTTETEIKIRISTDITFTDGENERVITMSNLTAGAWNFIRFNLIKARYLQIYGSSGSSLVLAIAEIKYLTKTDSQILQDLGILSISKSSTSIGLDGV